MTNSAIFTDAVASLRTSAPSAIFTDAVTSLRSSAPSAPFTNTVTFLTPGVIVVGADFISGESQQFTENDTLVYTDGTPIIDGTRRLLATVSGIDATVTGNTSLYTVPANKRVLVTELIVSVDTATAVSGAITAGVGINTEADDIISSESLTNLLSAGQSHTLDVSDQARIANAGEVILFGIDTAITGTAQSLSAILIGVQAGV